MVASLLQIVAGFSGIIGFLMRFIGPLTIAPTVTLIGLSVYGTAGAKAGGHWGIAAMYVATQRHGTKSTSIHIYLRLITFITLINRTTALIILFSQYLHRVPIPVPAYNKSRKLHMSKFPLFQIMPVCLKILHIYIYAFHFNVCSGVLC